MADCMEVWLVKRIYRRGRAGPGPIYIWSRVDTPYAGLGGTTEITMAARTVGTGMKVFYDSFSQPSRAVLLLLDANRVQYEPRMIKIAKGTAKRVF